MSEKRRCEFVAVIAGVVFPAYVLYVASVSEIHSELAATYGDETEIEVFAIEWK